MNQPIQKNQKKIPKNDKFQFQKWIHIFQNLEK